MGVNNKWEGRCPASTKVSWGEVGSDSSIYTHTHRGGGETTASMGRPSKILIKRSLEFVYQT
jgi:hypothetical protein